MEDPKPGRLCRSPGISAYCDGKENTPMKLVYLDNAATTPCCPQALAAVNKALDGPCGNPSSHYSVGYEAKQLVDTGRAQVAKALNAEPGEIFFTGCGCEGHSIQAGSTRKKAPDHQRI